LTWDSKQAATDNRAGTEYGLPHELSGGPDCSPLRSVKFEEVFWFW